VRQATQDIFSCTPRNTKGLALTAESLLLAPQTGSSPEMGALHIVEMWALIGHALSLP